MAFFKATDIKDVPSIPEYFKGKTIFLTGGSGFIGKLLVEKLLYSCPELDRIYLLLRSKKSVKPEDRLAQLYSVPCFDRLRRERPGVFESKVFFIAGDASEIDLGMSEEDRSLIANKTNIMFHVAASVRFDDDLIKATKLNVRGTSEFVKLAKETRNLESFIHISTSYSNTNRNPIDEVMYPPLADWRDTLEICEKWDSNTVQLLTPKYLGEMPNTYVFTKQLAEHVVYEQRDALPVVIVRPSIVVSTVKEPVPGWSENFNGPAGIIVASGKGILRAIYAKTSVRNDYIPADILCKGIIIAAWERGLRKLKPGEEPPIYNMCSSGYNNMTALDLVQMGEKVVDECPLNDTIWTTCSTVTDSKLLYHFKVLLFQVFPALIIDMLLWLFGKKTMLLKIQRRIYSANYLALGYYTTQEWRFLINNFISLQHKIKEADKKEYLYNIEDIDHYEYFRTSLFGGRRYLMKEKDEDIPRARAHRQRIKILARVTKVTFYTLLVLYLLNSSVVKPYIPVRIM